MIVGRPKQTASVPRGATEALERRARELLPSLGTFRVEAPWGGAASSDPRWASGHRRRSRIPNLLIAAGHGMMGVTYSLGTAELIAALCRSGPSQADVRPFSPERFCTEARRCRSKQRVVAVGIGQAQLARLPGTWLPAQIARLADL